MVATFVGMETPEKRIGRPRKKEPTENLRVPRSLWLRLRRIAGGKGLDAGDWVALKIEPIVDSEERALAEQLAAEIAGRGVVEDVARSIDQGGGCYLAVM